MSNTQQPPRHCWHNNICLICQTSRELRHWKMSDGNWSESTTWFFTQPSGIGSFEYPVCRAGIPQDAILEKAKTFFGFDIFEKTNKREVSFARMVTMELLWQFSYLTLTQIGDIFHKDHTTVISARKKVWDICSIDKAMRNRVIELETLIE